MENATNIKEKTESIRKSLQEIYIYWTPFLANKSLRTPVDASPIAQHFYNSEMPNDDKADLYSKKLDELYTIIQRLRPSSPPEEFGDFGRCFTPDCIVYLKSMNMHRMPAIARVEAIEDIKEVLEKVHILEREVLHFALASDGQTVFSETKQRIDVMGDIIEPFFETEVVTFDNSGLIKQLKIYSCWSPIVDVVQRKTGRGPYAEGERREQFEADMKQIAMTKVQKRMERLEAAKAESEDTGENCCT